MSMKKYIKKPVVIEAEQFSTLFPHECVCRSTQNVLGFKYDLFYIETLEGKMEIKPGDWIIKGIEGEMYPCKDSIFQKTYELVEG